MNGPEEIWSEAARTLERGKTFALATVINVRGSTPREIGAKMIVRDDGQFGTIGGGCGEAEVFRKARLLLERGKGAQIAQIDLTGDFDQEQVGTCGGIMDVFIDLWSPEADRAAAHDLSAAAGANRPAALVTLVNPGSGGATPAGSRAILVPEEPGVSPLLSALAPAAMREVSGRVADGIPALFEIGAGGAVTAVTHVESNGAAWLFVDPISGAQQLIIAGAGHIAMPLARLGSMLGFRVTIIDDRASFANRGRFPTAERIIVKPFAAAVAELKLDSHCYLVSVTRGHAFDEETIAAALRHPPGAFVGMIGSRRRARAMLERLAENGIPRERLEEVHTPLGVDIGAQTPEEIAIAIVAEIIRERRTGLRDQFTLGRKLGHLRASATG